MTNILRLKHHEDSTFIVEYDWTRHRFLLSNGETIDVWAVLDDSWVRDAVLLSVNNLKSPPKDHKYEITIVGVAYMPAPNA
jgi:hypothetical protein